MFMGDFIGWASQGGDVFAVSLFPSKPSKIRSEKIDLVNLKSNSALIRATIY